ncbi:MAG: glutamine--fructose-6-phosphate transaminase (isomerizing) [Gammaproteobacteria bacterium]|nr:glutamine--fructose-6-phosphate transaminase (isomerizing) [Gammaproteobacteria bacterium]
MCGIVGIVGQEESTAALINMLRRLDYRGYDSAGIAVLNGNGQFQLRKRRGELAMLEEQLVDDPARGTSGIGHTRWATHGEPTDVNAHPHLSADRSVAVVHNGIIENFKLLKQKLRDAGYQFQSDTDSEVIAHMVEQFRHQNPQATDVDIVKFLTEQLRGAYAILLQFADQPRRLIGLRHECPLNFVVSDGAIAVSSDISSLVAYSQQVTVLGDGQAVLIDENKSTVIDFEGNEVEPVVVTVDWNVEQATKMGFPFFLRKEISEIPEAARAFAKSVGAQADELCEFIETVQPEVMHLIACGSAAYSCAFAEGLARHWQLSQKVRWMLGSEYRYKPYPLSQNTLAVAVSQSGETADTIGAIRVATDAGAKLLGFVNVIGSTLDIKSDLSVHLAAGPEVAVPSTKAVINQFLATTSLVYQCKHESAKAIERWQQGVEKFADVLEQVIALEQHWQELAQVLSGHQSIFILGRGLDYPVAMEGALKLKETAYVHGEAMYAGEFKHGSISLVEKGMPILCLLGDSSIREKTISSIEEVKARGAQVVMLDVGIDIASEQQAHLQSLGSYFSLPTVQSNSSDLDEALNAISPIVALQMIAYHIGVIRDLNVDRPRNLAKSVTVE